MMQREDGDKNFPIWLLGDSNPSNWQDVLITPLDPRHPARHNIWTPVLDVIQDKVFRKSRNRVDVSTIYIRNAVQDPKDKPSGTILHWSLQLDNEIAEFRQLLSQHTPVILLSFGRFAFEFSRRVLDQGPKHLVGYWGARNMGDEFRKRIGAFDPGTTNLLPLLHTSISRGRYIESHNYFSGEKGGNYFEFAGSKIADILMQNQSALKIWIE
jgi:hypothetical protein